MSAHSPDEVVGKCVCGLELRRHEFSRHCAAYVCSSCGAHKGLERCYCGWSVSGGDGRRELELDGETIEPEDY